MLLFLRAIPEVIGIIGTGTVLVGKKVPLVDVVLAGLAGGIMVWIFRLLPLKFGIHTMLAIMVYIVAQRLILKLNLKTTIVATLLGVSLLGLLEYVTIITWVVVSGITLDILLADEFMKFVAGLPSLLGLLLVWLVGRQLLKEKGQGGVFPRWR